MAEWINAQVKEVKNWTDALFSLRVKAPIAPFSAGQYAKLALEIEGERVQRAYSYVNAPNDDLLEFYLVTVPDGKLSPHLQALRPGEQVMITKDAAGFFILDEVPECQTLWMLATGTAVGPYLSILQQGEGLDRFKHIVLVKGCRAASRQACVSLSVSGWDKAKGINKTNSSPPSRPIMTLDGQAAIKRWLS